MCSSLLWLLLFVVYCSLSDEASVAQLMQHLLFVLWQERSNLEVAAILKETAGLGKSCD